MNMRHSTILALGIALLATTANAKDLTFQTKQMQWEQVSRKSRFHLTIERQRYTSLDSAGRFVISHESGRGESLDGKQASWTVTQSDRTLASGKSPIEMGLVVVDFDIDQLPPGRYDVKASLLHEGKTLAKDNDYFKVEKAEKPDQSGSFALMLPRGVPVADGSWPMQFGVPLPKGAVVDPATVRVVDDQGKTLPTQATVRSRWGFTDRSSLRWLGLDVQLLPADTTWPDRQPSKWKVEFGQNIQPGKPTKAINIKETKAGFDVDTGPLQFRIRRNGFNLIDRATLRGRTVITKGANHGPFLVDHNGDVYRAANDKNIDLQIEEQGPLRVVLKATGWYVKDGTSGEQYHYTLPTEKLCKFITRIEAYAGKPYVRVLHTWILTYDTYTVQLQDVGLSLPLHRPTNVEFGVLDGQPIKQPVKKDGIYLIQHKPDRFDVERNGQPIASGERSSGVALVTTQAGIIGLSNRDTWQRFPKEFEVTPDALTLHVWPKHGRDHPEINIYASNRLHQQWYIHQGRYLNMTVPWDSLFTYARIVNNGSFGIYKPLGNIMGGVHASGMGAAQTSDFLITFATTDDKSTARNIAAAFQTDAQVLADPKWLSQSKAMGYVHPYDPKRFASLESIIEDYQKGYWHIQNETGQYGMWLYRGWHHNRYEGDGYWGLYRIYSAGHHHEPFMPWLLYARSGDPAYLEMARATIRSFADFMIQHYDDPTYPHKEYWSRQGRLVGSTKHTNGHVFWGGDHAVFGHLTTYEALINAYYLTGDLRLRDVVVEEWQNTIIADRSNPEFPRANRINGLGRDNNNSLGELIDLYQLTYHPALLAWIGPATDRFNQSMKVWGFPIERVISFTGNETTTSKLLEAAYEYRKTGKRPTDPFGPFMGHSAAGIFALAAIADPTAGFESEAFFQSDPAHYAAEAKNVREMVPDSVAYCKIPDYVIYVPRVLYAIAQSKMADKLAHLNTSQPMPIAAPWNDEGYLRIIVKEEQDQAIDINLIGRISTDPGVDIQVFGPDEQLITQKHYAGGNGAEVVTIPTDGKTGQYVLFIRAHDVAQDELLVPFTSLPEVYHTPYWSQHASSRFFTRRGNLEDGHILINAHKGKGGIYDHTYETAMAVQTLDENKYISAEVPEQGVWLSSHARYVHTKKHPVIISVSPSRWFMPDKGKLKLKPVLP